MNFYEMLCLLEDNKNKILHEQDQKTQELKNKILNAVDVWVKQVLDMLKNPSNNAKMGLWNRFKGGVQNLWYGRNNEKNPNYWRNRYGDELGTAQESYIYINLQNYNEIKNLINNLESKIITLRESDFDNLKIAQMVNQAGTQLKKMLSDILDASNSQSPSENPSDASAGVENSEGDSVDKTKPSPDRSILSPGVANKLISGEKIEFDRETVSGLLLRYDRDADGNKIAALVSELPDLKNMKFVRHNSDSDIYIIQRIS